MVIGDFNSKSSVWVSPKADEMGKATAECAADLDISLKNSGNTNTRVPWRCESIVNHSWTSLSAITQIAK